jgi:hypothetical protein
MEELNMEELNGIPQETVMNACKELCEDKGFDDEMFNALENPQECFSFLEEFCKPTDIVKHIIAYNNRPTVVAKPVASMKVSRRSKRRSKKKGSRKRSKKKRSKKRRSRKY